jgi:hypothetical protein
MICMSPPASQDPELQPSLSPRTSWRIAAIALFTSVAPFVVQTATLLLTASSIATAVVGAVLATGFAAAALAFQARVAGSFAAVPNGSRIGIVLAVFCYHALAYPVAHVLHAIVYAPR